ncbi:hypothetical protein [Methyloversatilis sp. XJ19-49]|uniref:hypothetical protein n=1 Tax=Methyloversatilis sp. XJ19-49 TaxID=2963429 RepID=UPI00211C98A2|nr:hypothetical protein [Methyloversatilis sp. XJ19-49]MCQ9377335.1 hypothetical protein [Methyloversatilis sp. XJ19-49]
MRFDARFGLLADFLIRFNLDLLPATTAPVMPNAVGERTPERRSRAAAQPRRVPKAQLWAVRSTEVLDIAEN